MPYSGQRPSKGFVAPPGPGVSVGIGPGLAADPPGGPCSPASAASEDTEVTLPATLEGGCDEAHEEAR